MINSLISILNQQVNILSNATFIGEFNENLAVLSEEESKHFSKVLRGKLGQSIYVIDGKGKFVEGNVIEINSKSVLVEVNQWLESQNRNYKIHMAIAPTKIGRAHV